MLSPEILFICFGAVFGLSWAGIPYKDMEKAKVFDKSSTNYEAELYNAFSLSADTPGRNLAVAVGSTAPVAGPAVPILNEVLKLVNPGSEWQRVVAATIDDTTDKKKFDGRVEDIKVQLRSIQTSLKNSRGADIKTVYWDTNKDFETLLNYFAEHKSILKKYPLVSSPILLDLVRFVAKLNVGINDHDMSCKIRNILLEYRRRSVDARLDKITTKWDKEFLHILYSVYSKNYDSPLIRSATFSRPYKKEGYGYDKPSEISCEKVPKHSLSGIKRYVMIDEFDDKFNYNVLDEDYYKSGSDNVYNYAFNDVGSYTRNPSTAVKCAMDYFGFIRYSVEQMFPVEMFEELAGKCGVNDSQVPSGMGYLTLKFKHASLLRENGGAEPEPRGDDPYIILYLNDTEQDKTDVWKPCLQCEFNYVYESDLIDIHTKISFAIWDKDGVFNPDDRIIADDDTKRTVAEYLQDGLFFLKKLRFQHFYNYIETVAFWTDVYEDTEIDDVYLRH